MRFRSNERVSEFKSKRIQAEIDSVESALIRLEQNASSLESNLEGKSKLGNTQLVTISNVALKEAREGAAHTVTQGTFDATTKTGTIGVGVTRNISVAASKGQTTGTLNQQSVTRRGQDELTEIDRGKIVISGKSLTFVGAMYTRNSDFENILESEIRGTHLAISSTDYEKTLIIKIQDSSEREFADLVIQTLLKNPSITSAAFKKEISLAIQKAQKEMQKNLDFLRQSSELKALN